MSIPSLFQRVIGSSPATPLKKPTPQTLFPIVSNEEFDNCEQDCSACMDSGYGRAFDKIGINTSEAVWGAVKAYSTHCIVATGEVDWMRDVEKIKNSLMERLSEQKNLVNNGRMMVSASNLPLPHEYHEVNMPDNKPTTIIMVPAFIVVEKVAPKDVLQLISSFINSGPTTADPLHTEQSTTPVIVKAASGNAGGNINEENVPVTPKFSNHGTFNRTSLSIEPTNRLRSHPYPHDFLILICSHRRRDARCGISAPILRKEFEKHLRPLGLWRDLTDTRAGGASVVFINHIGGHKYSANVIIYRKTDGQGLWLARINPKHVEGIVKHTLLEGKVIHPEVHLRGGWNRKQCQASW